MGEFTITKWKCDRCGEVYDKRPLNVYPKHDLVITTSYDVAAGPSLVWKEVCPDCNSYIGGLIDKIEADRTTPSTQEA